MGREKKKKLFVVVFCFCSGRLFDKDGNLKDWWSQSSTKNFLYKALCLVRQYNNYEVFGHYVSSYL